jgi:Zn-finger protein
MSNSHRCFLPCFGPFGQAVSEENIFRNRPIRNKNCLWWPCLLMDPDKMINLYREPFIDASYQVSVHLVKQYQRRFFRNQPIRNKNCLWWPCLLMDRDEMSNYNRGLSIDASYQVSVHLAKRFQMRRI